MKHIISLGAGVQSSTMALMAAHGEITPMPDCAIFADTGAEPKEVYDWLDWLEGELPFTVHRVMHKEGLTQEIMDGDNSISNPPFFTESGMLRRKCTADHKVKPIVKTLRGLIGLKFRERAPKHVVVTQWLGISLDEMQRMKDAPEKWISHRFPLFDMRMTRYHCFKWMEDHGYPVPPRSACTYCPYHSDAEWIRLKGNKEEWAAVVEFDKVIRDGIGGTKEQLFLHRDRKPIDEINFTTAESAGQISWLDECDGMCGV